MGDADRPPVTQDAALLEIWREVLHHPDAAAQLDALVQHPRARELVPAIPDQDLFLLVKHVGLADAHELVALASPEQFRTFVDLDIWRGDTIDVRSVLPWLQALVAGGCTDIPARIEELDDELTALLLLQMVLIYEVDPEEGPPTGEGMFYITPDGTHALELLDPELAEGALTLLQSKEQVLGPFGLARYLAALRHETTTPLLEDSYRWRRGRLEDLGFVPQEEARTLYYPLPRQQLPSTPDPTAGQPDTTLPRWLARWIGGPLLPGALEELESGVRERVEQDLVYLVNALIVADGVDPGDEERVAAVLRRARGYVEIALSLLGGGEPVAAAVLLRRFSLRYLFRWTSTGLHGLRDRAGQLAALSGRLTVEEQATLDQLRALPPRLPDGGEFQRPEQLHQAEAELRLLEDIGRTVAVLEPALRAAAPTVGAPGGGPVTALALFGSGLARRLLGPADGPPLLSAAEARRFLTQALPEGRLTDETRAVARAWIGELLGAPSQGAVLADRWCRALEQELGGLAAAGTPLDPRFVGGLVLAAEPTGGEEP